MLRSTSWATRQQVSTVYEFRVYFPICFCAGRAAHSPLPSMTAALARTPRSLMQTYNLASDTCYRTRLLCGNTEWPGVRGWVGMPGQVGAAG